MRAAARWLAAALSLFSVAAHAELSLAGAFGDHMVLQRGVPVRVWGQAEPGQTVQLQLAQHRAHTQAGPDGRWQARLAPLPAGGPHTLTVSAGESRVALADVLIGDLWVDAGQSNMEWILADAQDAPAELAAAEHPLIRHAKMPHRLSLTPQHSAPSLSWQVSSPATAGGFSAVAYHFARRVQAETGVPIGLLNLSWGGTLVETWTSVRGLRDDADLAATLQAMPPDIAAFVRRDLDRQAARVARWQGALPMWAAAPPADWARPEIDDHDWPTLQAPQVWESQGLAGFDGVVWLRKTLTLSAAEAAGAATLQLGPVDDCEQTWVNGQAVGEGCGWDRPRAYAVPAGLLHAGPNLIAVRVLDTGGDGGLHGPAEGLRLETVAGPRPLAGAWQARVEAPLAKAEPGPNDLPSLIFNGMVQAFTALPVRGVIWYQGETNAAQAARYAEAFPRLIRDWRAHWAAASGTAALPFYFVQLSSFGPRPNLTGGSPWAELREAQQRTLALPATGMAVSIDVGDAQDIHPRDKRPVGERLARIALAHTYHRAVPFSGPRLLGSRALPGGRFELRFDSPLQTRDGAAPRGFTVAGADQRFVPAQVSLAGRRAVVAHPGVPVPTAVRYAWADTPLDANLVGANGLPAAPLRTDRFPLVTRNAKPEF